MKKKLMFLITLLLIPILVNAEETTQVGSKYYDHIWTSKYFEETTYLHGINEVYEYDEGIIGLGAVDAYYYKFKTDGTFVEEVNFTDPRDEYEGNFKYKFELNGKTYVLTGTKDAFFDSIIKDFVTIYEITEDGELTNGVDIITTAYIGNMDDFVMVEGKDHLYFFEVSSEVFFRLKKDFSSIEEVEYKDANETDKEEAKDILAFAEDYYVIGTYKDGYIGTYDNYDASGNYTNSTFGYYADGKVQWTFIYSYYEMYPNVVLSMEYNDNVMIALFNEDYDAVLLTIDENGKILEENYIDPYFEGTEDYLYFKPQHLIDGENGFYLSGYYFLDTEDEILSGDLDFQEYGALKQEVLMYFEKKYTITSKTDGNGTVTHSPDAYYKNQEKFTITPNEGYVIDEIKVTDPTTGKTVIYTDTHEFVMPNHDVLIDVTFVKQVVENPKTGVSDYLIFIIPVLGLGLYLYNKFNKKNAFRNI